MIKKFLLTACIICLLFNLNAQKGPSINGVPLGMVSYTYRQSLQKDMPTTLDSLKALKVYDMEFSSLFGKKATEIRKLLDERGMYCSSIGVSYQDALTKSDEVASNAKSLGAKVEFLHVSEMHAYIGSGIGPYDSKSINNHLTKEQRNKDKYLAEKMSNESKMSSWGLTIKLADRLDNVSDLKNATKEFRNRYTKETHYILEELKKNRKLSNTHKKLIKQIEDKLNE